MIEKLLEHLPYDLLEGVKFSPFLLGGAGAGALLFAVYFFTLHQATREELVQLQNTRTQMEKKLNSFKKSAAEKDTIANELARATGKLDAMKQQLPREKDLPGLLKEVASFGDGRGTFDITRFQLEEGNVDDFYKEIPVAIQMRGSFWDTMDFLDKMQNRLQLVNFSDLKMDFQNPGSSPGGNASIPLLSTKLVASTYAYIEGAEDKVAGVQNSAANKK